MEHPEVDEISSTIIDLVPMHQVFQKPLASRQHYQSVSSNRLLAAPEIRNTVSNPSRRKHNHTA